MNSFDIYKDIAERTGGDIYIGVVGPVRTGKSTFIKNFMDNLVIPNISNDFVKTRTQDELPQSAEGTAIMTTEPKFVPNEAVSIDIDDVNIKVRLIDCVGYIVDGATGHTLDNKPRMVSTPWSDEKMPFAKAAELGTSKVINDHSTIAIMLTTDGTITDIPRENYINTESRVVKELVDIGKPFVIVVNSADPQGDKAKECAQQLEKRFSVPVVTTNCKEMTAEDITNILEEVLYQFPVSQVNIAMPKWIELLDNDHWLKSDIIESVKAVAGGLKGIRDIDEHLKPLNENRYVKKIFTDNINLGEGMATVELSLNDELFYNILSETTGMEIESEYELIAMIKQLAEAKKAYDKLKYALDEVNKKGYGIVTPSVEEMNISSPELVKLGSRYGVRIDAEANAIHLVKTNIKARVSPVVGSEEQSKDLVSYLSSQYKSDPQAMWDYSIFGRSLKDLITDDLNSKLMHMPEDVQFKFKEALQKIINEGSGGLICIML